jgi:hypothetical protein
MRRGNEEEEPEQSEDEVQMWEHGLLWRMKRQGCEQKRRRREMRRASWQRRRRFDADCIKCQVWCGFLDTSFPQQQRLPPGGIFAFRAFGAEGPAEGVVGVQGFGGVAVVEQDGEFQRAAGLPFAVGEVFQGERDFQRGSKPVLVLLKISENSRFL